MKAIFTQTIHCIWWNIFCAPAAFVVSRSQDTRELLRRPLLNLYTHTHFSLHFFHSLYVTHWFMWVLISLATVSERLEFIFSGRSEITLHCFRTSWGKRIKIIQEQEESKRKEKKKQHRKRVSEFWREQLTQEYSGRIVYNLLHVIGLISVIEKTFATTLLVSTILWVCVFVWEYYSILVSIIRVTSTLQVFITTFTAALIVQWTCMVKMRQTRLH